MKKLLACILSSLSLTAFASEYNRSDYMPSGWDSYDGCITVRHQVLAKQSYIPVTWDETKCKVISGAWFDLYTGLWFTDPTKLDIDHVVPLKEAHESGASNWSNDTKRKFANWTTNPMNLVAVSLSANRSKGDKDPYEWMPSNPAIWPHYLTMWITIKSEWKLQYDEKEARVVNLLKQYMDYHRMFTVPTELLLINQGVSK